MQDPKFRLLAFLFAVTALNLLCFFEAVHPMNVFAKDESSKMRQAAKAYLSAALSVFEKSTDDKEQTSQNGCNGGDSASNTSYKLSFALKEKLPENRFNNNPLLLQQKLWLLNRALLI